MKVALIDPSLFTLPYDRCLLRGLQADGHEVLLFGRRPGADDDDVAEAALRPLFYRVADSGPVRKLPRALRLGLKGVDHLVSMLGLRRALAAWQPDVIHFQWLSLPLLDRRFLPALRRIAPLVLTVHDTNPFNGDPSAGLQQRGFFDGLALFDLLIVHTRQGEQRMRAAGIPAAKLALVPHGRLVPLPPPVANPMDGPLTLLLFGKIKPYKGLDVLLDAFAALPPALRDGARVRVVGKPYLDLEPLRAQAARLGIADRVAIEPRFVADGEIAGLFGPGTVAVFPYREIEASGVLSIALAHGCPVVASALGSFAEDVVDGETGLLVPPGDVAALSAALVRVLADRGFAARAAVAARHSAEAIPSWASIGRDTAARYRALPGIRPDAAAATAGPPR